MPTDYNQILEAAVAFHSTVIIALAYWLRANKDNRKKLLWKLAILEVVVFPFVILAASYIQSPISMVAVLSDIVYSIVVTFVGTVEVPGFLLLSKFDGTIVDALENTRKELVIIGYSFDHLAQLNAIYTDNEENLRSASLYTLIGDFIGACERMKNLDKSFWALVIGEVTLSARSFSERSKHPFPKLFEILSLAGLSFLLAQFLRLIG